MNAEILFQNIFNLFLIAIVLEAAIMAIFSMSSLRQISDNTAFEGTRDAIMLILAFVLCWKVDALTVFRGTGIKLPHMLDVIISALVLTRLINFIRLFMSRLKRD